MSDTCTLHWRPLAFLPVTPSRATQSSILAWRIPWTVQSLGLQRIQHDWATFTFQAKIHTQLLNITNSNIYIKNAWHCLPIAQFSSVAHSCLTLCNPKNRSTPGLPVHHELLEFTQTHVHWVGDAIQPSHPLSCPSSPTFNLSQWEGNKQEGRRSPNGGNSLHVSVRHFYLP